MVDGDTTEATVANTDYPCDVCGEALARFWHEDKGAVCETCGRDYVDVPTWKADEIITLDNDIDCDSMSNMEADADALASAGWGTDEDYGYCDNE